MLHPIKPLFRAVVAGLLMAAMPHLAAPAAAQAQPSWMLPDLVAGRAKLDASFRGVAFPGGFSYADVLDSGKGWAGTIRFNAAVLEQFTAFYARPDTFSLGVCNGCQLAALLGWVPFGPRGSHAGVSIGEDGPSQMALEDLAIFRAVHSSVVLPSPQ